MGKGSPRRTARRRRGGAGHRHRRYMEGSSRTMMAMIVTMVVAMIMTMVCVVGQMRLSAKRAARGVAIEEAVGVVIATVDLAVSAGP